jgi:hypothetical protein
MLPISPTASLKNSMDVVLMGGLVRSAGASRPWSAAGSAHCA